ncbi:hypothetical protein GCM10023191_082050 [Actinoallomurus oryzae]|uniref:ATP-binding protein n=2 Tax=Actinoallomurus oryzae TaxID=502180 RepID=A0ABP8QZN5_9ACTN
MATGAYAPLLISGNTDSALLVTGAATASVGANVITEILQDGVEYLRGHEPSLAEIEEWLAERFEQVLEAGDSRAVVLQGQLALIFDAIGASQTASRAAIEHGDRVLQTELATGLAGLGERFDDVGAALAGAHLKLDRIHCNLDVLTAAQQTAADRGQTSNTINGDHLTNAVQVGTVHGDITIGAQAQPPSPSASPVGLFLAQLADPFALEVHRPVELQNPPVGLGVLPAYVPREHDARLAQVVREVVAGESRIAVLVGGSSTGKTRACWEALGPLRERPEPWRLWHPIHPTPAEAALAALDQVGAYTVIWLNEAQFYLDTGTNGLGERLAASLRDLLRDVGRGPVLILATLWPEYWTALTTPAKPDVHAQARELLAGQAITVPDAFTPEDLRALSAQTGQDPRLAEAADDARDGQITQYLAGVPVLMDRYDKASPATAAFIHAAMDARRLGCGPHLPLALLAAAAPSYLTDAQWDQTADDWLQSALDYVATPCNGIPGILTPIKPGPARNRRPTSAGSLSRQGPEPMPGQQYRLADYLDQHGRLHRAEHIPPIGFWTALAAHADATDLRALGDAAWGRGLSRDAAQLYKNATALGDGAAAVKLVRLVEELGSADRQAAEWAAARVALDNPLHVGRLLRALRRVEAKEQVAVLLARDPAANVSLDIPFRVGQLLVELREVGAVEQVAVLLTRDPAANVSLDNPFRVGELLLSLHAVEAEEQVTALARRAAAHVALEDPHSVRRLLDALREVGAVEQVAVLLAREPAANVPLDNPYHVGKLLLSLHAVEAEEHVTALARRAAAHVALGDPHGVDWLLEALREVGAVEQVAMIVQRLPAAGGFPNFILFGTNRERFTFGREPDGSVAAAWTWADLI